MMEAFIVAGSAKNLPAFDCSWQPPEYWQAQVVKRPVLGAFFFGLATIFQLLYLPCLIVMLLPTNIQHASYKIMLFLGFMDVSCVAVAGQVSLNVSINLSAGWILADRWLLSLYSSVSGLELHHWDHSIS